MGSGQRASEPAPLWHAQRSRAPLFRRPRPPEDRRRAANERFKLDIAARVAGVLTTVIEDEDIEKWAYIERGGELVRRAWLGELAPPDAAG